MNGIPTWLYGGFLILLLIGSLLMSFQGVGLPRPDEGDKISLRNESVRKGRGARYHVFYGGK